MIRRSTILAYWKCSMVLCLPLGCLLCYWTTVDKDYTGMGPTILYRLLGTQEFLCYCYLVIEFLLREQTFFMACNKISGGARISFQRCLVALSSLSLPSSFVWIFFSTSLEGVILFYCPVNLELLFRKCASLVAHCALFSYWGYCCITFSEILNVFIHIPS